MEKETFFFLLFIYVCIYIYIYIYIHPAGDMVPPTGGSTDQSPSLSPPTADRNAHKTFPCSLHLPSITELLICWFNSAFPCSSPLGRELQGRLVEEEEGGRGLKVTP